MLGYRSADLIPGVASQNILRWCVPVEQLSAIANGLQKEIAVPDTKGYAKKLHPRSGTTELKKHEVALLEAHPEKGVSREKQNKAKGWLAVKVAGVRREEAAVPGGTPLVRFELGPIVRSKTCGGGSGGSKHVFRFWPTLKFSLPEKAFPRFKIVRNAFTLTEKS